VFVVNITDEFNTGLDVLQAYNAFMDLGHHVLLLGCVILESWSMTSIIPPYSGQQ
jgi:hypothetical protein